MLEEDPWVNCLLYKCWGPAFRSPELEKKPNVALGNKDWWTLGADCLCCRAKIVSFRFNERPCLRKEGGEMIMERHLDLGFCLHMYQNRKNAHTHFLKVLWLSQHGSQTSWVDSMKPLSLLFVWRMMSLPWNLPNWFCLAITEYPEHAWKSGHFSSHFISCLCRWFVSS